MTTPQDWEENLVADAVGDDGAGGSGRLRWWPSTLVGLCLFGFAFVLAAVNSGAQTVPNVGGNFAALGATAGPGSVGGGGGGTVVPAIAGSSGSSAQVLAGSSGSSAHVLAGSSGSSAHVLAGSVQALPSGAVGTMVLALLIGLFFLASYRRATRRTAAAAV